MDVLPLGPIRSDGKNIYFVADGGVVTAIGGESGTPEWRAELGGKVISNLLIRNGEILVVTAPSGGPETATLRSISNATGTVNWTAAIHYSKMYFLGDLARGIGAVGSDGSAHLLRWNDGSIIWSRPVTGTISSAPQFGTEHILLPLRSGNALAISADDGSVVKGYTSAFPAESLVEIPDRAVVEGDDRGNLIAFAAKSGNRLWKFKAGARLSFIAAAGSRIVAISADNFVYMLSLERGNVIWKRRLSGRVVGDPALSVKYLIAAATGESSAFVIDLKNGRFVNQITLPEGSSFVASPVNVTTDRVAAVTSTGISLWSFGTCKQTEKATQ